MIYPIKECIFKSLYFINDFFVVNSAIHMNIILSNADLHSVLWKKIPPLKWVHFNSRFLGPSWV